MNPHRTALAALLALTACRAEPEGISREKFIRANVELRIVADSSVSVDSARARALRKERVTPNELRAWLAANQNDPEILAETWEEIAKRAQARVTPDSAAAGKSGSTGNFTLPPETPPGERPVGAIPRPGETRLAPFPPAGGAPPPPPPTRGTFDAPDHVLPPGGLPRPPAPKDPPRPGPPPTAPAPAPVPASEPAPTPPDTTA
ncbi:MAG TPA: hypothetical protein VF625_06710 [Longimicrobium sp.]